ncbi:U3 small nucleolar RNA-associated protein 11 [Cryphonectria parasitica EP155]|uniref:U3 small nucleolar RNA-associated protein 11 n=1 Tax=Cryphonectria parasitica (strain ATCC 38755 / EP155) TaxID=660469 RepID=A0A9P4Y1C6_CRYP1|nr:U3 small nucleolar RNA-associated protein 11 [Cryphonectria parasitica EP155]KAF3764708.1 U3 small nucleolar RNA-associated protein 11 [Cryphonectria parasitica EP155]
MSSLRNSIQRRSHRERGQLKERERLGLLEKHKDYALRAKDHKKKQTVLKSLKQKAAERNEDEFYFGMVSRGKFSTDKLAGGKRWTGTVAGDRGNKAMDVDTVRLLKTQDIGYLRTMRNVAAKEVARLEQRAVIAGAFAGVAADAEEDDDEDLDSDEDDEEPRRTTKAQSKPKKIVFADTAEDRDEILPEPEDSDDDMVDMDDRKTKEKMRKRQNAERLRQKLQTAKKKLSALTETEMELEMQRAKMAKTATVGGITKKGKNFKVRERKR